jgi:hypothetical protein
MKIDRRCPQAVVTEQQLNGRVLAAAGLEKGKIFSLALASERRAA